MSTDSTSKESLYTQVAQAVTEKTSVPFSKANAKEIVDSILQSVIETAISEGEFTLPKGYGSFSVKQGRSGSITTPAGVEVAYGPRKRITYKAGAAVKRLLG